MNDTKRTSLIRPTVKTRYHIDFEWWRKNDRDWRVYLYNYLCPKHQALFSNLENDLKIDWVDPKTAEIKQVDGLQHILITHCARQEDFIIQQTTMVDAVFRVFLANSNQPMSPEELAERLGRPSITIMKTLSGGQIYKGLRPYVEE